MIHDGAIQLRIDDVTRRTTRTWALVKAAQ
jgi:hypothetical protein